MIRFSSFQSRPPGPRSRLRGLFVLFLLAVPCSDLLASTNFNPRFASVQSQSITVQWDEVPGDDVIPVLALDAGFSQIVSSAPVSYTPGLQSATFTGLNADTRYFYRMKASTDPDTSDNPPDNTAYTAAIDTTTPGSPLNSPAAPTNLQVTGLDTNSMSFSWTDNSDNETGFRLQTPDGTVLATVGANVQSATLAGLTPNELVQARVAAYNAGGTTVGPDTVSRYTLAAAPGTPAFSAVDRHSLHLSWGRSGNPATVPYEVTQSEDNFATFTTPVPFSANLTDNGTDITGLSSGHTYYFRVKTRNGDGTETAYSAIDSTVTPTVTVIVSTGGVVNVGQTTLVVNSGTRILISERSDGTLQHTLQAGGVVTAAYGNGISLRFPAGSVDVYPTSDSLQASSALTVTALHAGASSVHDPGSFFVQNRPETFVCQQLSGSQRIRLSLPASFSKRTVLELDPPPGAMTVELPAGTFTVPVTLTAFVPSDPPGPEGAAPPGSSAQTTGVALEVDPDRAVTPVFPIPVTLSYRIEDIPTRNPQQLSVLSMDDATNGWSTIPGTINTATQKVTFLTTHFSLFELAVVTPADLAADAQAFPNPLRPFLPGQQKMTFRNLGANASVKIYTWAGTLVRELSGDGNGVAEWDARNKDGEKVASGGYLALVQSSGGYKKVLTIAVEK